MYFDKFFKELKRRSVYKVAVTYGIVTWLVAQMAGLGASSYGAPEWVMKMIILVLIIGFPIALVLAWAFEMSPEGIIRTTSDAATENPLPDHKKKPLTSNLLIGFLLLVIAGQFIYNNYWNRGADTANIEKSIAVLPFRDISPTQNQQYLGDGMMIALIDKLIHVDGINTRSRTSVFRFINTDKTIQEIANELSVDYILEGDVQRYADQLRVNVRLVDPDNENPIEAWNYDRLYSDIFNVQIEIAQNITSSLNLILQPPDKQLIQQKPSIKIEAYTKYIQGYEIFWRGGSNTEEATKLFEEAIEIDSLYATAYAELALTWMDKHSWAGSIKRDSMLTKAKPLLNKATILDPEDLRVVLVNNQFNLWILWDFEAAEKGWQKLSKLTDINKGEYASNFIDFLLSSGRYKEAAEVVSKAIADYPGDYWVYHPSCFYMAGLFEEAKRTAKIGAELFGLGDNITRAFLYLGDYETVISFFENGEMRIDNLFPRTLAYLGIAYYHLGNLEKTQEFLDALNTKRANTFVGSPNFYTGMLYSQMQEIELAFECLDRGYDEHEVEMYWLKMEPPFEPLYSDSRWQEMLDKVGFPD